MPMHKTFTPIIWAFQSFSQSHVDEIIYLDNILETSELFESLIEEIELKAPEMPESTIANILERAC
ncbi:MAG: hypothetical protein ACLFNU_05770 [Bacteroidales bacterium]